MLLAVVVMMTVVIAVSSCYQQKDFVYLKVNTTAAFAWIETC